MIKKVIFLIFVLTLAACAAGGSPSQAQLERVIFERADLPAEFSAGLLSETPPKLYKDLPPAERAVYQQFEKDGTAVAGATIFIYADPQDLDTAYRMIAYDVDNEAIITSEIGERSLASYIGPDFTFGEVVYTRCGALVHLRLPYISGPEVALGYAERLDGRLERLLCGE